MNDTDDITRGEGGSREGADEVRQRPPDEGAAPESAPELSAQQAETSKDTGEVTPTPAGSGVVVRVFGRTDVGLVREHNEDNFLIADLTAGNRSIKPEVRTHTVGDKGSIFVVCDGMGGAAAGEVASQIGVDTIYEIIQSGGSAESDEEVARRLDKAISEAGTRIYTAARLDRGQRGMGTTVTAAIVRGGRLIIGQVGDSRAHIVRKGRIIQVTKDQSLVQQLIDAKQLTEEEARNFDKSNIILQALGTTENVHVDMTSVDLRRGDALVMCSDGLSGLVPAEQIRDVIVETDDPMEACRRLTEMASAAGGHDNITVIVARFEGDGLPEPAEEDEELAYRKFSYLQVTETTARSAYPKDPKTKSVSSHPPSPIAGSVPEGADDRADREAAAGRPSDGTGQREGRIGPAPSEPGPWPPRRGRRGAVVGVVAAVMALVAVAVYLFSTSSGETGERTSGDASMAPSSVVPVPPVQPIPSATGGSDRDRQEDSEPIREPVLAPTPEAAITNTKADASAARIEETASDTSSSKTGAAGNRERRASGERPPERDAKTKPSQPVQKSESKKPPQTSSAVVDDNPY